MDIIYGSSPLDDSGGGGDCMGDGEGEGEEHLFRVAQSSPWIVVFLLNFT